MSVTYIASGATAEVAASPADIDVAYLGSLVSGDLLLAQIFSRNTVSSITAEPSGWTLLFGPDTGSGTFRQWIYYKISDGTETGTARWSISGSALFMGRMHQFRGTATSSFTQSGGLDNGNSATLTIPSVTTTRADSLAVAFPAIADDNTMTDSSGETGGDYTKAAADYLTTAGLDGAFGIQTATMASPGTISGGSITAGASDPWLVRAFALMPPAAPISQTAAAPVETLKGVSATITMPVEANKGVSATAALPFETTVLSSLAALTFETTQGRAATQQIPVETLDRDSATAQVRAEALQTVRATIALPVETTKRVSATASTTVEAPSPIPLDTYLIDAPVLMDLTLQDGDVKLRWGSVSQDIDGYRIYRGSASGAGVLYAEVAEVPTDYLDTTVPGGGTFFYTVTAFNATDESPHSNELSVFIGPNTEWDPPDNVPDSYYAGLPWHDAQVKLGETGPQGAIYRADATWHGTRVDGKRGAFTLVKAGGPLASLVGERIRVTMLSGLPRTIVVYVDHASSTITEDLSLTRRAFMGISLPTRTRAPVKIEVLT